MTTTRERILSTALERFNRDGERNVSTNHLAEAVGISPGNLYYHFRNKAGIVFELFEQYEQRVEAFLQVPADRPMTVQDKVRILEAILDSTWGARFLHRDLGHLLNQDPRLRERYGRFVRRNLVRGLALFQGLRSAGLIDADDATLRALLVNTWVLATSWAGFVHSLAPPSQGERLDRLLLEQGIYQIVCLEAPYLRGEAVLHLEGLKARFLGDAGDLLALLFADPEGR